MMILVKKLCFLNKLRAINESEAHAFEKKQKAVKDRVAGMRPRGSGARHRQKRGQAPGIGRLQELHGQNRELVVGR
jgi:hypothetical protein